MKYNEISIGFSHGVRNTISLSPQAPIKTVPVRYKSADGVWRVMYMTEEEVRDCLELIEKMESGGFLPSFDLDSQEH